MNKSAVIFDLDGVIVSTDEYHYQAWKHISEQEGIPFNREINEKLRGVSRMESLEIILSNSTKSYSESEKLLLAEKKNEIYRELLNHLSEKDILPGVRELILNLKGRGIKIAIGSSSKNTPFILEKIGMASSFDAIADGNGIKNSKPDPEVFLLAAQKLGVRPEECIVMEDAEAGIEAAIAGGMVAVGVGAASTYQNTHIGVEDLTKLNIEQLFEIKESSR
ncbi:beta-phosphoglucomutase [Robertmurraya korlensis]|uniref:beta-phosphoglucomutase n=1 Tax=Robertmurraya korlensis TaxID=519977 RepID=UPI0008251320|nr:beta-phosphoglucomutase [Robertmurraya korlensis]